MACMNVFRHKDTDTGCPHSVEWSSLTTSQKAILSMAKKSLHNFKQHHFWRSYGM